MSTTPRATRIGIDLRRNELVIDIEGRLPEAGEATIDIGAAGRLLGVEVGEAWVQIAPPGPGDGHHARSALVGLTVSADGSSFRIPRRGPGWEISFPSGNQCWRIGEQGQTLCSVVVAS